MKMEEVAIFHACDGESWSSYLGAKLQSEEYTVPVRTELLSTEEQHFSAQCSVQVVLMTPNLLNNTKDNKSSLHELLPNRCVVVLLGVDKNDVVDCLGDGEEKDSLFECRMQLVDSDSASVRNAIVAIIETYEEYNPDESDGVYSVPPPPKQINSIFQVVPKQVQQGDNLFLFLDRKSEKCVTIHCGDHLDEGIVTDSLDKAIYCCKVPDTVEGEIELKVESGGQSIGTENIIVSSKLQALKSLLEDVCNPVELMCQALGLSTASTLALDEALVKRLKLKSRSDLFSSLMEDLRITDDNTHTTWPTLLHFAAAYNLEKLTDELLQYPAMVLAACTENCKKEYPSTIAEKNGFKKMEKKLVDFVIKQKDSGINFDMESPTPHISPMPDYVNSPDNEDDDDLPDYVDMSTNNRSSYINMVDFPKKDGTKLKHIKAQLFASKKSYSESDTDNITFVNAEEEAVEKIPPPFSNLVEPFQPDLELPAKTNVDRLSAISGFQDDDHMYNTPPSSSPVINIRKISEVQTPQNSLGTVHNLIEPLSPVQVEVTHASPPPCRSSHHLHVLNMQRNSLSSETSSNVDNDSICQDNISVKSGKNEKRGSSISSAISFFIRRLKRPRFNSSGDVHKGRRTKFYTRSDPGFDDPAVAAGVSVMTNICKERAGQVSTEIERDSGSYSEEEDGEKASGSNSKKEIKRAKTKGSKNAGVQREKSVRVKRALKDDTGDAPTVPDKTS